MAGWDDGGLPSARQRLLLGRPVDPNRATAAELDTLPGVSRKVAHAWVAERSRRGAPFRHPEELLSVRGIKGKRLAKILPFLAPFADNN